MQGNPMPWPLSWFIDNIPLWMMAGLAAGMIIWFIVDTAQNWMLNLEEIACVAIKYDDIGILALPAPARHHHVMWTRLFIDGKSSHPNRGVQGFLTTHGRFVDRKAALRIAMKRDQIEEKNGSPAELYSEDMWDTPKAAAGWSITHLDD